MPTSRSALQVPPGDGDRQIIVGATLVVAQGRPQGPPLRKNEPAIPSCVRTGSDRRYSSAHHPLFPSSTEEGSAKRGVVSSAATIVSPRICRCD